MSEIAPADKARLLFTIDSCSQRIREFIRPIVHLYPVQAVLVSLLDECQTIPQFEDLVWSIEVRSRLSVIRENIDSFSSNQTFANCFSQELEKHRIVRPESLIESAHTIVYSAGETRNRCKQLIKDLEYGEALNMYSESCVSLKSLLIKLDNNFHKSNDDDDRAGLLEASKLASHELSLIMTNSAIIHYKMESKLSPSLYVKSLLDAQEAVSSNGSNYKALYWLSMIRFLRGEVEIAKMHVDYVFEREVDVEVEVVNSCKVLKGKIDDQLNQLAESSGENVGSSNGMVVDSGDASNSNHHHHHRYRRNEDPSPIITTTTGNHTTDLFPRPPPLNHPTKTPAVVLSDYCGRFKRNPPVVKEYDGDKSHASLRDDKGRNLYSCSIEVAINESVSVFCCEEGTSRKGAKHSAAVGFIARMQELYDDLHPTATPFTEEEKHTHESMLHGANDSARLEAKAAKKKETRKRKNDHIRKRQKQYEEYQEVADKMEDDGAAMLSSSVGVSQEHDDQQQSSSSRDVSINQDAALSMMRPMDSSIIESVNSKPNDDISNNNDDDDEDTSYIPDSAYSAKLGALDWLKMDRSLITKDFKEYVVGWVDEVLEQRMRRIVFPANLSNVQRKFIHRYVAAIAPDTMIDRSGNTRRFWFKRKHKKEDPDASDEDDEEDDEPIDLSLLLKDLGIPLPLIRRRLYCASSTGEGNQKSACVMDPQLAGLPFMYSEGYSYGEAMNALSNSDCAHAFSCVDGERLQSPLVPESPIMPQGYSQRLKDKRREAKKKKTTTTMAVVDDDDGREVKQQDI